MSYVVLLYYKYTRLEAVEEVRKWQVGLCERLGLKGRIRLAKEGVNGTVGGNALEVAEYEEEMRKREEFRGVEFKRSTSNAVPFRSLRVEVRPELVTLGLEPDKISYENAGEHITPQSFHEELLRKDRNTVVIDVRNEYETKIGRFDSAVVPPTRQFSDFPKLVTPMVDKLDLRQKRVLLYCTGGVRCERGSAYLRSLGVMNVFQLHGGVHAYLDTFRDGGLFRGKNFVFDERVALTPPDQSEVEICGECDVCCKPYDDYSAGRRCQHCRVLVLVCEDCAQQVSSFECKNCPALVPKPPRTRAKRRLKMATRSVKIGSVKIAVENVVQTDM